MDHVFRQLTHQVYGNNHCAPGEEPGRSLYFSSAQVLQALEHADGFLAKRPLLRVLYTQLACVNKHHEIASTENFVKYRIKERLVTLAMAQTLLHDIYRKAKESRAFEAKVNQFKVASKAKSLWCVRNPKCIQRSPSQHYGVHLIPPKPKSQRLIDLEHQLIKKQAHTLYEETIRTLTDKFIEAYRAARRKPRVKMPEERSKSRQTADPKLKKAASVKAKKLGAAERAKLKREREMREVRCKELRLQLVAPHLQENRSPTSIGAVRRTTLEDGVLAQHEKEEKDDDSSLFPEASVRTQLEQFLALVEANGDVAGAKKVAASRIALSGFRRAIDHAHNLGVDLNDTWELVKIWRKVYRNHTIQSVRSVGP